MRFGLGVTGGLHTNTDTELMRGWQSVNGIGENRESKFAGRGEGGREEGRETEEGKKGWSGAVLNKLDKCLFTHGINHPRFCALHTLHDSLQSGLKFIANL